MMNLGNEPQNFLIFIALMITGDDIWATNLSPATKVGDGAHRCGGNQAYTSKYFLRYYATFKFWKTQNMFVSY